MKLRLFSQVAIFLAIFTLAMPLWAKTMKATMDIDQALIGTTHLKAGSYEFVAKDNDKLIVQRSDDGKQVAEVNGEWKDSKTKPDGNEVVLMKNQIREVHFAHKNRYFKLQ